MNAAEQMESRWRRLTASLASAVRAGCVFEELVAAYTAPSRHYHNLDHIAHILAYAHAIRQEYAWVPEADFRTGRRRVLESFLQRERFYFTAGMRDREPAARQNLAAELQSLQA
jgi:predicted metal-dependent HD superfamily phosphohydrolase